MSVNPILTRLALITTLQCAVPVLAQPVENAGPAQDAASATGSLADAQTAEEPALSDLDRAYAAYSLCVDEAAKTLAEAGEAAEVIGVRALAACGEERAAYVNAFYFALLPHAGETDEPVLRARAGRLVSQTDSFLIAKINEDAATPADSETDTPPAADQAAAE